MTPGRVVIWAIVIVGLLIGTNYIFGPSYDSTGNKWTWSMPSFERRDAPSAARTDPSVARIAALEAQLATEKAARASGTPTPAPAPAATPTPTPAPAATSTATAPAATTSTATPATLPAADPNKRGHAGWPAIKTCLTGLGLDESVGEFWSETTPNGPKAKLSTPAAMKLNAAGKLGHAKACTG